MASKQSSHRVRGWRHNDLGKRALTKAAEYLERASNRLILLKENRATGKTSRCINLDELQYWKALLYDKVFDEFEDQLEDCCPSRATAQNLVSEIQSALASGEKTCSSRELELFDALVKYYASCVVSAYTLQHRK